MEDSYIVIQTNFRNRVLFLGTTGSSSNCSIFFQCFEYEENRKDTICRGRAPNYRTLGQMRRSATDIDMVHMSRRCDLQAGMQINKQKLHSFLHNKEI